MKHVPQIEVRRPIEFPDAVRDCSGPALFRGLVAEWPLVGAARRSNRAVDEYLRRFYNGSPVTVSVGEPDIKGRIFYDDTLTGFNFRTRRGRLDDVLDEIRACEDSESPPVHYIGSTTVDLVLPGLRAENDLPFHGVDPSIRIWIGNRTRIAAHYDVPDNVACVAAGRRRFTLFPPDQLENLYVGPLDLTPAGQSISLVDLHEPDFDRFPRFREALRHAQVADMEPGDALFIPGMWWHHVEGLDPLNVLVNYWWRDMPAYLGTPLDVLNHALLSIRDLPVEQREIWQGIFDHYIFKADDTVASHIPEHARGVLAPIADESARRLRAILIRNLNR
ncbi:MAG: cupin [Gammaproteobacteria bacterium SG8_30]|nr:MAG: cupin [Gammaproteobacteria bacterium SG8_30]